MPWIWLDVEMGELTHRELFLLLPPCMQYSQKGWVTGKHVVCQSEAYYTAPQSEFNSIFIIFKSFPELHTLKVNEV